MQHTKTSSSIRISRLPGFTLTELLVVIVIIAVLAAVLFPIAGHVRGKTQGTEALHRIRQCGGFVLQKATDNHNNVIIHAIGTHRDMDDLRLYGMVEEVVGEEDAKRYVHTPAFERQANGTWHVWGVNLDSDPENRINWEKVWFERGGEQRYAEGLNLARCETFQGYPLLADSANSQGVPRARFANDNQHKFAMRYSGKGPIFFLDGSSRLVGQGEMAKYGITQAYLFEDDPVTGPTLVNASEGS